MLSKSLAVIGLLSAMTLASPAGALSFGGGFFGSDRAHNRSAVTLRLDHAGVDASALVQSFSSWNRGPGFWNAPSDRPRQSPRVFPSGRVHPFTGRKWGCSDIAGRNCGPRPGSAVPEPGAALLFGAGALLIGRRLRAR
jgi:hypothetical protein